jgi:hypothetical protein
MTKTNRKKPKYTAVKAYGPFKVVAYHNGTYGVTDKNGTPTIYALKSLYEAEQLAIKKERDNV